MQRPTSSLASSTIIVSETRLTCVRRLVGAASHKEHRRMTRN
jgi:hypothetical protein